MPRHLLEVTLQGKTFTLRTEMEPSVFLQAVAAAEGRIQSLEAQVPGLSPHKAALLALLQASEECLAAQKALEEFRASVKARARRLREALQGAEFLNEGTALPREG